MPGPALNPIANTAPVTPAQSLAGAHPDASTEAAAAGAPEQGFASELKRQMKGEDKAPDTPTAEAKIAGESDDEAADAQAMAQLPPELAALLVSIAAPASPAPASPQLEGSAPGSRSQAADARDNVGILSTSPAGLTTDSSRPGRVTAATTDKPADLAAKAEPLAATPDKAGAEVSALGKTPERTADLAAPANNFAALHAAALANLRGEAAAPASSPVLLHVAAPAGSPRWPEEVGNRVNWMVGHDESRAELTLTPPQLGKIEISITISGDQTSAQFVTATPAAREMIEQSMPRLREILEQSGISLGQTDVGTSGQPGEGRREGAWRPSRGESDGSITNTAAGHWLRRVEGLVDTFA